MNCGPKFLHLGHAVTASLLSRSIPGQNHLSCNLSRVWSHPKWPFCSCTFDASLTPSVRGMHSTRATRSLAFVQIRQSQPSWIEKLRAQCLAWQRVRMSCMSLPVRASTTSLSQGSSANCLHNVVCSSMSFAVLICIMSFMMPELASQLGWTDQLTPSSVCSRSLASNHFWLMASATTFVIPGRCRMSTMFLHVIDSSHRACVALCFLFRSTSRRAWQSVSISIGDPYIMGSKSSRANFSAANSSMNGSYFSSLRDVRFEQNARGCHLLHTLPWSSVLSNSWQSIPYTSVRMFLIQWPNRK